MIGRLIGIDHGEKRIGLAVSDALGISARELAVLECSSLEADLAQICDTACQHGAVGFVIGIPYNPNAPQGIRTQADLVRDWITQLRKVTTLPVAEVSEYLTSDEARGLARGLKRGPREHVDDLAARIILQTFLDALSNGFATFPQPDARD